jgi:hypothetical protein
VSDEYLASMKQRFDEAHTLASMKKRFDEAYAPILGRNRAQNGIGTDEAYLYKMKVEFDAAMALVRGSAEEVQWVRNVLAEHGYIGPLSETTCPLREWLAPQETQPVPEKFTEYVIEHDARGRIVYFSLQDAMSRMGEFAANGEKFTFSTGEFKFADEWKFACNMLAQGQPLSGSSIYALKIGVAAGMTPDL